MATEQKMTKEDARYFDLKFKTLGDRISIVEEQNGDLLRAEVDRAQAVAVLEEKAKTNGNRIGVLEKGAVGVLVAIAAGAWALVWGHASSKGS